jgi:hypothetical protein
MQFADEEAQQAEYDAKAVRKPGFRLHRATQNRMHAVPQTTVSSSFTGLRLRPGFKMPGKAAFLGGKVNERLRPKPPISAPHAAHSQDLIDFSSCGGI